jgi:hypothetical protein
LGGYDLKKLVGIFIMLLLIGPAFISVSACTGFTYNDENNVYACSNEDCGIFNFNLRFFPPENGKHGMLFFEKSISMSDGIMVFTPQAGMNDQGLWWDAFATPYLLPVNSSDKPNFTNSECYYKDHIGEFYLAEYSSINEAIDLMKDYNNEAMSNYQIFTADSTGNSAIIEGDDIIYKEGNFQAVSNFLQSHPELGALANGFERYNTAVGMIENMTEPSIEYFRDILDATHLSGTVYSMICDLENLVIYIYFLHDYEKLVVIDLNEELEKGEHYIYIGSLFEPEGNQPPVKPESPTGDETGIPGEDKEYRIVKTTDSNGDKISYIFDWGDGTESFWLYNGIGVVKSTHNWSKRGTYEIRVKARDIYGAESEWSDPLTVTMPKNKLRYNIELFFEKLFERFPILQLLLK